MKTLAMQSLTIALGALTFVGAAVFAAPASNKPAPAGDVIKPPTHEPAKTSPLDFTVKDINGKEVKLSDYKGKVVMLVNVASKCGNTPQYKPLEALYEKYKDQGLVIIGFPANEFGHQEPGSNAQIKEFCESTYHVNFPMMSKIIVKGEGIHPLYAYLTDKSKDGEFGGEIGWNFAKFIVDRNGNVIARLAPKTQPDSPKVVEEIEAALKAKPAESEKK